MGWRFLGLHCCFQVSPEKEIYVSILLMTRSIASELSCLIKNLLFIILIICFIHIWNMFYLLLWWFYDLSCLYPDVSLLRRPRFYVSFWSNVRGLVSSSTFICLLLLARYSFDIQYFCSYGIRRGFTYQSFSYSLYISWPYL